MDSTTRIRKEEEIMSNCTGCDQKDGCVSVHASINEMHGRTREMGVDTVFDRYQRQQPQCGFGMQYAGNLSLNPVPATADS